MLPLPLVRARGVLMRASTIPIAITLTLTPAPALPFDQDEFCAAVTDVAGRMNARRGKWLDRSTRHDGVSVDCESKTLEAKRFLNIEPDAIHHVQSRCVIVFPAHLLREQGVGSSNLPAPTNEINNLELKRERQRTVSRTD